jgi:hypothetical protein
MESRFLEISKLSDTSTGRTQVPTLSDENWTPFWKLLSSGYILVSRAVLPTKVESSALERYPALKQTLGQNPIHHQTSNFLAT